jgi:uncharacterized protein (DUF736 family)
MIIGTFRYFPNTDKYEGIIETLALGMKVWLVPNDAPVEKGPDYLLLTVDGEREIGAGWKRESEKSGPFVSISFDDPVLPAPINAALFPDDEKETATLVWKRRKDDQKPVVLTARLAQEGGTSKRAKSNKAA